MRHTGFQPPDWEQAATVYDVGGPAVTRYFSSLAAPGGGLWSTAADLITFGQALLRGGRYAGYHLLGPAAIATMTRLHTHGLAEIVDGRPQPFDYGLGWAKPSADGSVLGSERSHGHSGITGTLFWVDPEWDLVFVFLTNRWGLEQNTARRVLNAVYGALEVG